MDMNKPTDQEDVMDAEQILEELHKLIARERSENEPEVDKDVATLEDAAASVAKFVEGEKTEMEPEMPENNKATPQDVVDTGVLTGPINGLKNFLVKKAQDNNRGY